MFSTDNFLDRTYDRKSYNCYHFLCEVWKALTRIDLVPLLTGERLRSRHIRRFIELPKPVDPCIVVMQRGRDVPHVGIYVRGRVLHLQEHGVDYQPLHVATIGFTTVRYATTAHSA